MANIPPEAILRFSQYSTGAADDAALAELSSLARAPENPELWEVNMHRHSQAYSKVYCQVAQASVAQALGEIRDFDPYVCEVSFNLEYRLGGGMGPGGLTGSVFGRAQDSGETQRAPFVYSHMVRHVNGGEAGLAVYFVASFVGESLGATDLGFVVMRHVIVSGQPVSPVQFQCLAVAADTAGDSASWWPSGELGEPARDWITGKFDALGTWIFAHHSSKVKYTVIPTCGSISDDYVVGQPASFCTPDGVLHADLPPAQLSTASVSQRHATDSPWGCIQLLWDAGVYEDEHPLSASGDTDACERLLSYELAMSEESRHGLARSPRNAQGPTFFTLRAAGRTHHAGRVQSSLVDLGELGRDEWCAESSQPFWQVVAQRTYTVATRSSAVEPQAAADSSSDSDFAGIGDLI
jgi:hypothetical protein